MKTERKTMNSHKVVSRGGIQESRGTERAAEHPTLKELRELASLPSRLQPCHRDGDRRAAHTTQPCGTHTSTQGSQEAAMTALLPKEAWWHFQGSFTPLTQQQRSRSESLKHPKRLSWNTTIQGVEKERISIFQGAVSHVCRDAGLQENKGKRALSVL